MTDMPEVIRLTLQQHGQEHVLAWWDRLDEIRRQHLLRDLQRIDFAEVQSLYARREQKESLPERARIQSLPHPSFDQAQAHAFRARGEEALRRGEVAFLVVAGGQGTRLGFNHPKGMFLIGPVSHKSLFQIHAEKILALRQRYQVALPFLIMTSPATDEETRQFFAARQFFGLPQDDIWFFCQGTMPAVDLRTGRLCFEKPGMLCLSPNGHGGTLTGLRDSGLLDKLEQRGIRTISYFQVDNPLTKLADYVFLGRHLAEQAQISSKILPKTGPQEKVGNFALVDGRCAMIEYSDLPEAWAKETDAKGELVFWAANPAIHLFDVAFIRHVMQEASRLPWHVARKKVPCINEQGETITPAQENALKFERFIFDVLPQAERWTVLPTSREEEFAPVKNADGVDSAATARQAMCNQAARWLRQAGVEVPLDAKGNAAKMVEISPLFAMDADDVRAKVQGMQRIEQDTYFGE